MDEVSIEGLTIYRISASWKTHAQQKPTNQHSIMSQLMEILAYTISNLRFNNGVVNTIGN